MSPEHKFKKPFHANYWFLENKKMSKRENPHFVHVMSLENTYDTNIYLKKISPSFLPTRTKDIFFCLTRPKGYCNLHTLTKNLQERRIFHKFSKKKKNSHDFCQCTHNKTIQVKVTKFHVILIQYQYKYP